MIHPITPPPELVQQWDVEGRHQDYCTVASHIAARAAQWGSDQELEACCEWIAAYPWLDHPELLIKQLRAARRSKPPSLKEQAQAELKRLIALIPTEGAIAMAEPIRRALEALPDG
jgi:hypothetical protein